MPLNRVGLLLLFYVAAARGQQEQAAAGTIASSNAQPYPVKTKPVEPKLDFSPEEAEADSIVGSEVGLESEAPLALPEEVSELSPEAQAVWRKAAVKPKIPAYLHELTADKQVRMLGIFIEMEAVQREEDKNRPPPEFGEERQEADDRAELVRAAPKEFKPEAQRKLKLTLIPRKTMLRKGEPFWYRLELQNLGSEPLDFHERDSFFKLGNHDQHHYRFYVTYPDGKERPVGFHYEMFSHGVRVEVPIPGAERMTDEQRLEAAKRIGQKLAYRKKRQFHLHVTLEPGETLFTRPWRYLHATERQFMADRGEDPFPPVPGQFRELALDVNDIQLDKVGTYRIKMAYLDMPLKSPDENEIKRMFEKYGYSREQQMKDYEERAREHFGRVDSNSVAIEVVP